MNLVVMNLMMAGPCQKCWTALYIKQTALLSRLPGYQTFFPPALSAAFSNTNEFESIFYTPNGKNTGNMELPEVETSTMSHLEYLYRNFMKIIMSQVYKAGVKLFLWHKKYKREPADRAGDGIRRNNETVSLLLQSGNIQHMI